MMLFTFILLCCTVILCNHVGEIAANSSVGSRKNAQTNTWAIDKAVDYLAPYLSSINFSSYYLVTRTDTNMCLIQVGNSIFMLPRIRPVRKEQLWNLNRNGSLYEIINAGTQRRLSSVNGTVVVDSSRKGAVDWRVFATVGRFAQILHDSSVQQALTWDQNTGMLSTQLWVADNSQFWKLVLPFPLRQSELFGGSGGEAFDDGVHDDIIQITLRYNSFPNPRIFLIQATYVSNGIEIEGPAHGNSTPGILAATFSLSPKREFINKISGVIGPCSYNGSCAAVAGMTFHVFDTSDGSTSIRGPYGLLGGLLNYYQSFETPISVKVVGFTGRSSQYLNAISIDYYMPSQSLLVNKLAEEENLITQVVPPRLPKTFN